VEAELVDRAGPEVLAGDVGAAVDLHVPRPRGAPSPGDGAVDAPVTDVWDVPPLFTIVPAGRVVTTSTGAWKTGSSPHGPMPRSAIRRPTTTAPMPADLSVWNLRDSAAGLPPNIYSCRASPPRPIGSSGLTSGPVTGGDVAGSSQVEGRAGSPRRVSA
jgi:hypothetical protein